MGALPDTGNKWQVPPVGLEPTHEV
jgi:hypothetical protein